MLEESKMLLNLNQKFATMDGKIMKDVNVFEDDNGDKTQVITDLTLERVISLALSEPADQKMSGADKIKCFELLLRVIVNKGGEVELKADEIAFIQNLVKVKYRVLIVGQAVRMLDNMPAGLL